MEQIHRILLLTTAEGRRLSGLRHGYYPLLISLALLSGAAEMSGMQIPICDAARSARARNSPAAPSLEAQCQAAQGGVRSLGRVRVSSTPSGAPIPICDAARSARARNSPAAASLQAQCLALGGDPAIDVAAADMPTADQLAAKGAILADNDALSAVLRQQQREGPNRRGFDIGMGASEGQTLWGPNKQKILESLSAAEQEGFKVAISFVLDRNRYADRAAIGAAIAENDPVVAQARTRAADVRYWLGFDIASGIFGDRALGAQGNTATGPGSLAIRDALSAPAQEGFNASVAFHLSRHY